MAQFQLSARDNYLRSNSQNKSKQRIRSSRLRYSQTINVNSSNEASSRKKLKNKGTIIVKQHKKQIESQRTDNYPTYEFNKLRWVPIINAYDPSRLKNIVIAKQQLKTFFDNHNPNSDPLGQLYTNSIIIHFNEWKKKINRVYTRVIEEFISGDCIKNLDKIGEELKEVEAMTTEMRENVNVILNRYENHRFRQLLMDFQNSLDKSAEIFKIINIIYESKQKIENIMIKLEGKKQLKKILKNLRDSKIQETKLAFTNNNHFNNYQHQIIGKVSETINYMADVTVDAVDKIQSMRSIILRIKTILNDKDQNLGFKGISEINQIFTQVLEQARVFKSFSQSLDSNAFFGEQFKKKIYVYEKQMSENKDLIVNSIFKILDSILGSTIKTLQQYYSIKLTLKRHIDNFSQMKSAIKNMAKSLQKADFKQAAILMKFVEGTSNNFEIMKDHINKFTQRSNDQNDKQKYIDELPYIKFIKDLMKLVREYKKNIKSLKRKFQKVQKELKGQKSISLLDTEKQLDLDDQIGFLIEVQKVCKYFNKLKIDFHKVFEQNNELSIFNSHTIQVKSTEIDNLEQTVNDAIQHCNKLNQLNQNNILSDIIFNIQIRSEIINNVSLISSFLKLVNEINKKNALTKLEESTKYFHARNIKNQKIQRLVKYALTVKLYHLTEPQRIEICKTHIQKLMESNKQYILDLQQAIQKRTFLIQLRNRSSQETYINQQLTKAIQLYDDIENIHKIKQKLEKNNNTHFVNFKIIKNLLDDIFSWLFLDISHPNRTIQHIQTFISIIKNQLNKLQIIKMQKVYKESNVIHVEINKIIQFLNQFTSELKQFLYNAHKCTKGDFTPHYIRLINHTMRYLKNTKQDFCCLVTQNNQPIYIGQSKSSISLLERFLVSLGLPHDREIINKVKEDLIQIDQLSIKSNAIKLINSSSGKASQNNIIKVLEKIQDKTKSPQHNKSNNESQKNNNSVYQKKNNQQVQQSISDLIDEVVEDDIIDQKIPQQKQSKNNKSSQIEESMQDETQKYDANKLNKLNKSNKSNKSIKLNKQKQQVNEEMSEEVVSEYQESKFSIIDQLSKQYLNRNDKKNQINTIYSPQIKKLKKSTKANIYKILEKNSQENSSNKISSKPLITFTQTNNNHSSAIRRIILNHTHNKSHFEKLNSSTRYYKVISIESLEQLTLSISKWLEIKDLLNKEILSQNYLNFVNSIYIYSILNKKSIDNSHIHIQNEIKQIKSTIEEALQNNLFKQIILKKQIIPKLLQTVCSLQNVLIQENLQDRSIFFKLTKQIAQFFKVFGIEVYCILNSESEILFMSEQPLVCNLFLNTVFININTKFTQQEIQQIRGHYFQLKQTDSYILKSESEFNWNENNRILKESQSQLKITDFSHIHKLDHFEQLIKSMWIYYTQRTQINLENLRKNSEMFLNQIKQANKTIHSNSFQGFDGFIIKFKKQLKTSINNFLQKFSCQQQKLKFPFRGDIALEDIQQVIQKIANCKLWPGKIILFEQQLSKFIFYGKSIESKTPDFEVINQLSTILFPKINLQLNQIIKIEAISGKRKINYKNIFSNLTKHFNSKIKLDNQINIEVLKILNQKYFQNKDSLKIDTQNYQNQIQHLKLLIDHKLPVNNTQISNYQRVVDHMINIRSEIVQVFRKCNQPIKQKRDYSKAATALQSLQKYFDVKYSLFYTQYRELLLMTITQNKQDDLRFFMKQIWDSENINVFKKLLTISTRKEGSNVTYKLSNIQIYLYFEINIEHVQKYLGPNIEIVVRMTDGSNLYRGKIEKNIAIDYKIILIQNLMIELLDKQQIICSEKLMMPKIQQFYECKQISKYLENIINIKIQEEKERIRIEQQRIQKQKKEEQRLRLIREEQERQRKIKEQQEKQQRLRLQRIQTQRKEKLQRQKLQKLRLQNEQKERIQRQRIQKQKEQLQNQEQKLVIFNESKMKQQIKFIQEELLYVDDLKKKRDQQNLQKFTKIKQLAQFQKFLQKKFRDSPKKNLLKISKSIVILNQRFVLKTISQIRQEKAQQQTFTEFKEEILLEDSIIASQGFNQQIQHFEKIDFDTLIQTKREGRPISTPPLKKRSLSPNSKKKLSKI